MNPTFFISSLLKFKTLSTIVANFVLIVEATTEIPYKREHISLLLRKSKIKGRKVGGVWFVDLDDLKEYYVKMENLGSKRHTRHNLHE